MFVAQYLAALTLCIARSKAQYSDQSISQYLSNTIFVPNNTVSFLPLLQDADTPDLFPMAPCGSFILEEATIDQMQEAMSNGTLSSVQLTLCYLQRTLQTDEYINSLLQFNPEALSIASSLDAERASGTIRSPLHGIPFTLKDNIATADTMETTAGSYAILGNIVPRDAHVISRLRAAGAVVFGKATLSEWADMRTNNYSEGYSARGGQARSPYNLTTNPGGSSSGSAAGVAANCIAFSIGTETDGSVINPAERNGLVGFKPTVGLTSRAGVVPESEHQDSVGSFARTVRDAVHVLDGMYGPDSRDNYTSAQINNTPFHLNLTYADYLSNSSILRDATFGLPWESLWQYADEEQLSTLLAILALLQSSGATILNNTEFPSPSTIVSPTGWNWDYGTARGYPNESEYTVVKVDFYNNIATYLSELNNTNIRSLADIVNYNYDNDATEGGYPYAITSDDGSTTLTGNGTGIPQFWTGQDSFLASLETNGTRDETYFQALNFTQSTTRAAISHALTAYSDKPLSALLVPTDVGQSYQIAAQAQTPMLTLPAGYRANGMGFGLGLMVEMWGETELVRWGSAIEDLITREGASLGVEGGVGRQRPKWGDHLSKGLIGLAS